MTRPAPTCRHCGCLVKRGQLMCRAHWFALPQPLRRAINATWRGRQWKSYLKNVREADRLLREDDEPGGDAPPDRPDGFPEAGVKHDDECDCDGR